MNTQRLQRDAGFTLVELMIAMVLGLLVTGGVIGIFVSNQQIYRQNENLARLQENARYALEVMSRDIREAGGVVCGKSPPIANVLNNADTAWWSTWGDGIRGYDGDNTTFPKAFGTNALDRVSGTDAIVILSGTTNDGLYIKDHNETSANFKVNTKDHGIEDDDILMICDDQSAAIFQVTNASSSNVTIVHNTGSSPPGNCTKSLGCAPDKNSCGDGRDQFCPKTGSNGCFFGCDSSNEVSKPFNDGGFISKFSSHAWYIGNNRLGGRSLYRIDQEEGTEGTDEIVDGVRDLQLQYLTNNSDQYVDANTITDWGDVTAVRLTFTFETLEEVNIEANSTIQRDWFTVVQIRNR